MLVGRDAERALGKTLYKRVMSESRLLPSSHPLVQAVTAIGTRIAAAVHDVEETSSGSVESQLVEVVEKGLGRPKVEHPKEPDEVTSNGRQAESLAEMLRTSTASSGGPVAVAKADNWDWHFIVVDNPAKVGLLRDVIIRQRLICPACIRRMPTASQVVRSSCLQECSSSLTRESKRAC